MYNLNDARRMPENVGTGVDNQIHSLQWRHHYVATRSPYQQNRGMSIIPYATPTSKLKDHVTSTFLCWVCFRFKAMAWRHGFAIQTIPGGELARPLFQAQLQGGSKPLWLPNVYMYEYQRPQRLSEFMLICLSANKPMGFLVFTSVGHFVFSPLLEKENSKTLQLNSCGAIFLAISSRWSISSSSAVAWNDETWPLVTIVFAAPYVSVVNTTDQHACLQSCMTYSHICSDSIQITVRRYLDEVLPSLDSSLPIPPLPSSPTSSSTLASGGWSFSTRFHLQGPPSENRKKICPPCPGAVPPVRELVFPKCPWA